MIAEKLIKLNIVSILLFICLLIAGCDSQLTETESVKMDRAKVTMSKVTTSSIILVAGQNINVGEITVTFDSEDKDALIITYVITDPNWYLTETHLDVQTTPGNFPTNVKDNPKLGHFLYGGQIWSHTIDLNTVVGWSEGSLLYIAAHADVESLSGQEEGAWGVGQDFGGNSGAMYFSWEPPSWECGDPITDERDGKTYNTVLIGDQCWFKENLNIGTSILNDQDPSNNGIVEKYCYDNDPDNCDQYGGFYQWNEAMQYVTAEEAQGICPDGWHIPTEAEFRVLESYVDDEAAKLVDESQTTIGYTATNETGFSALFAGFRRGTGGTYPTIFNYLGDFTSYWSSTEYSSDRAHYMGLYKDESPVYFNNAVFDNGYSIRCLKD